MANVLQNYENLKKELDFASTDADRHGKIVVQVGSATCEKAAGSDDVRAEFEKLINASGRDDIVIKQTGCTGRCSQEPIVGVFLPNQMAVKYQKVSVDKVQQIFQEHCLGQHPVTGLMLDKTTDTLYTHVVTLCSSSGCRNKYYESWYDTVKKKIDEKHLQPEAVRIIQGGCIGLCHKVQKGDAFGVMMVFPENVIYKFQSKSDLDEIIEHQFVKNELARDYLVHTDSLVEEYFKFYGDVSFFNKQTRITLRNCGIIDPESLTDYIHAQGYEALARVLYKNDSDFVIEEVMEAGLRGRGGGGYPTGIKWKNTRDGSDDPIKYVICNADEGDPGAFMDRSALEGDPFSIIEGMTIGAFAMGASKGYLYIRAEYPLAISRIEIAIQKARRRNLLGDNILGSKFSFDLEIRLGAGAFVCGEETALIQSIEGNRGQPIMRPPYPSEKGLWGHPTSINNVETWANVPAIMLYGSDWFSRIGTEGSKGTKVFALAGKVNNTGLVEVPMGTTLREVIYDIGGGIPEGKQLKAVQTGGPSGGCIPLSEIDTPVDYESLKKIGSMMGSGGMIILDESDCIVATAKFFLEFTKDESCGKCLPCREGTVRMLEIMEKITSGKATMDDVDKLKRLGNLVQKSSLCGLGQAAPNPVLSALKHFPKEFETHIIDHRCPTQKCSQLIQYQIIEDKCTGCTLCARRCPVFCIRGFAKKPHEILQEQCIKCGECYNSCNFDAIVKI
jgi:NADH:ubiquinone oxidoreductase subunit F (NADH-binding)/(2Fe-2S) ferredoxin/NAD-dependent dihydropyrimidine dehydrogenase PreA subunit